MHMYIYCFYSIYAHKYTVNKMSVFMLDIQKIYVETFNEMLKTKPNQNSTQLRA